MNDEPARARDWIRLRARWSLDGGHICIFVDMPRLTGHPNLLGQLLSWITWFDTKAHVVVIVVTANFNDSIRLIVASWTDRMNAES
jgi:hypothetical protein